MTGYDFSDNVLLNLFLVDPNSRLLENLIAIFLKKKYAEKVFYYKKNIEVDFYVPKEKLGIQLSYKNKIAYFTTMDFLYQAMVSNVMTEKECDAILIHVYVCLENINNSKRERPSPSGWSHMLERQGADIPGC